MKISVFIIFLGLLSVNVYSEQNYVSFNEFEYLDRSLILKLGISEIEVTITEYKQGEEPEEDAHSCIVYTHKFDRRGNIILHDLNRVGSSIYYKYDDSNNLIDWGHFKKFDGEESSLAEYYKSTNTYKKEQRETESSLKDKLISKVDYRTKSKRAIQDPCFSLDAIYEIAHQTSGQLPKKAVATWDRELGTFMRMGHKSKGKLYIYYDYSFFK